MTTDVRTLLHDSAEAPSHGPDIARALHSARTRRRRQRGVGGLVAVVVVALVVGLVALDAGGGDGARVAIGPRQTGSVGGGSQVAVPDGWKTVTAEPRISIAIPPEWDSYDFGETPVAQQRVSVGTSAPTGTSVLTACDPEGEHPTVPGTWLTVWEYPADDLGASLTLPDGSTWATGAIGDRPADFRDATSTNGRCPFVGNADQGELGASFEFFVFRDAGRVFLARSVVAYPVVPAPDVEAAPRLSAAREVLNTLHAQPLGETIVTTTLPNTTTPKVGPEPTSSVPAFEARTDDERAIAALIVRWLTFQSDDGIRETLVGADSILDLIHEGMSQYQMNLPDGYTGTLTSLQFTDATHADFVFTLLLHGSPLYANQTGAAVKVDGRWMITRESECSLLAHGALICPPE